MPGVEVQVSRAASAMRRTCGAQLAVQHLSDTRSTLETSDVKIEIDYKAGPRLKWYRTGEASPFFADSETRAYSFDVASGAVLHYVERESHLPLSEDEGTSTEIHPSRNEFIYGLGESRGTLEKSGKRFTMEGRDALSYDWEHGGLRAAWRSWNEEFD